MQTRPLPTDRDDPQTAVVGPRLPYADGCFDAVMKAAERSGLLKDKSSRIAGRCEIRASAVHACTIVAKELAGGVLLLGTLVPGVATYAGLRVAVRRCLRHRERAALPNKCAPPWTRY